MNNINSNAEIHPTAVIATTAVVGDGCKIGPYCIINENVVLGKNNTLRSHVVIDDNTTVGDGNTFFQFCSIGAKTQDLKYSGEPTYAKIGDNNTFREYVTVHRGTSPGEYTTIGDSCTILAYCHIAHNCIVGSRVIMSNVASLAGHVEVGDGAIIAGMSGVHQFCKIGDMAFVGGMAKLTQDVLPFCIAEGYPAATRIVNKVGLSRSGRSPEVIRAITNTYKAIFKRDLKLEDAITELNEKYPDIEEVQTMIKFATESERGLAR